MLWVPNGAGDFTWMISNIDGVRPSAGSFGRVVPEQADSSAAAHTKGAWVEVLTAAQMAQDALGLFIASTNAASTAQQTDLLLDIGVDPAGGTSYTTLIPNLILGGTPPLTTGGNQGLYFPIWIKAGSSVGARHQCIAAGNHMGVVLRAFGKPRDPSRVWCGTSVEAFGIDTTNSRGTLITPGTTSEGAWTLLASAIAKDYGYWQLGFGINDNTISNGGIYSADLAYGDASNKHIIIQDQFFMATTANETVASAGISAGCGRRVKNGNNLYGRLQCSGTADTNPYAGAWGVF